MRKRGLISVLILSLLLSSIIPHKIQAVTEQAKTAKTSDNYVEGEAIVTLNASSETGLAKEGTTSFDSDIAGILVLPKRKRGKISIFQRFTLILIQRKNLLKN